MWLWKSNIAIIIRTVHVLDMWSVLCVPYVGVWSKIVIGVYVLDMWSVLWVLYVGSGV